MKYSLSIRQPNMLLEQADEIRLNYNDINALYDKIETFPKKKYVVIIPKDAQVEWNELRGFASKCNLILGIEDLALSEKCNQYKIKFFWVYGITTFYELQGLLKMHIAEVVLAAPLYFDLKGVKDVAPDVAIRVCANLCTDKFFPFSNGLKGTYVRPEDVSVYEPYVQTLYFDTDKLSKEEILFNTYKDGMWPGNLNTLLTNLDIDVDNRGIPDEFGPARIQCRQNCMRTGKCNFCNTAVTFTKKLGEVARSTTNK